MDTSFLQRMGVWSLGLAALLAFSAPYLSSEADAPPRLALAKQAGALGAIALAIGYLLQFGTAGKDVKPCPRCGGRAAKGSAFCPAHRDDLAAAVAQAAANRRNY